MSKPSVTFLHNH